MAHPKRRQSKTRTLKRRTHDKAVAPTLILRLPHCLPNLRLLQRQGCNC